MDIQETEASPVAEGTAAPVEDQVSDQPSESGAEEGGEETNELDDLLKEATGADEATPDELIEVEIDGKMVKVSADAKDFLMRHKDYTHKTMELAEQRKSVEAKLAEVQQFSAASEEQIEAVFAARAAQAKVQTLLDTPIDGLSQDEVNGLRLDLSDAQRALAHHSTRAQEAARQSEEYHSQQFAKAVETARTEAAKHIPNFNDTRLAELGSLVATLGGNPDQVKQIADPTALRVLHLADIGAKFIERQRQAGKATAAQSVQPATELGGKSKSGAKDLIRDADKMTSEEWIKQRNADLKKAGR